MSPEDFEPAHRRDHTSILLYAMYGMSLGALSGLGLAGYLEAFYFWSPAAGAALGCLFGAVLGRKAVEWLQELASGL